MHRLLVLAFLAPLLGAQTAPPDRGVNFYSIEKEQALGAQLASEYLRTARVIDDAAVKQYLDGLGQRLAGKAQGPAFRYTFELVDGDRPFLHEPVAFPGGAVFVPAGLILAAVSEDELAGMLAHAIEHIAARHGTKQATKGELVNQASVPLILMGEWQGTAVPQGFAKFQRQSELQADALAAHSMAAAGYDPGALVNYIERVQPADALPLKVTSPYPDREGRLAALRTAIEGLPASTYPAHDGFAAIQAAVARHDVKPAQAPPRLAR
jgi:predicted Zn-dependent protease